MLFSFPIGGPNLTMNPEKSDKEAKTYSSASVPVKMKRKTLKHVSQSDRLEIENRKMEERLRSLRETMLKEKEERESAGCHWSSGKTGPLASHAVDVLKKNVERRRLRPRNDEKEPLKVKLLTAESPKKRPIAAKPPQPQKKTGESSGVGGLLLQGTYDESASAQSFAEALKAWRQAGKESQSTTDSTHNDVSVASCEIQAGDLKTTSVASALEAAAQCSAGGISYMERLLLKKMRANQDLLSSPQKTCSEDFQVGEFDADNKEDEDDVDDELLRLFASDNQIESKKKRNADVDVTRSAEQFADYIVEEVFEEVKGDIESKVQNSISEEEEEEEEKAEQEIWKIPIRPYSGLDKFFLVGKDKEGEDQDKASVAAANEEDSKSLWLTKTTTWNPLLSQTKLDDKAIKESDSDDSDDGMMPVYMRPSSVIQNVPNDVVDDDEDEDGENDQLALDNLASELRSMSQLEHVDDSVATGGAKLLPDPDTFMKDFEELEKMFATTEEFEDSL